MTREQKTFILCAGGHAKVIIDAIECAGTHQISGLLDDHVPIGTQVSGYTVLGPLDLLKNHPRASGILACGDNHLRHLLVQRVLNLAPDFCFLTIVHPSASVARRAILGEGTVVMAGAKIQTEAHVGPHSIINTGAIVEHDCRVGSFCHVAPGAILGGNVTLGAQVWLGLGARVIQGISIGDHTLIGAGATVLTSVRSSVVAAGTPAQVIRERSPNERFAKTRDPR